MQTSYAAPAVGGIPMMIDPPASVPLEQRREAQANAVAMLLVLAARDRLRPETRRMSLDILHRAGYGPEHIAAVAAHCAIAQTIARSRT